MRAELDHRSKKEITLEEETKRQGVTILELEANLTRLKEDIEVRQGALWVQRKGKTIVFRNA